jgi:hypothetical protein
MSGLASTLGDLDFLNDTLLMPSLAHHPHQSAQQMFEDLVEARALNFNQVRSEG